LPLFLFQINLEMMALIESLQCKAVEEGDIKVALDGSNDDEECADGDSDEDDDAMERDEDDDISLDDEDQDSAGDKKTECPNDDSDVNIDGSVKIVVDIKEEKQPVKKYKGGDAENGKDDEIKVSAPEVVAVLAEENPAKQTKKGSKGADNKESQPHLK
jgi:E3 ubiquitin-protein ligase UHRF1